MTYDMLLVRQLSGDLKKRCGDVSVSIDVSSAFTETPRAADFHC